MIIRTRIVIKSNAKTNCMSNKHAVIKTLKLNAIEINKHPYRLKVIVKTASKGHFSTHFLSD